jgi:hypothetical protein
MRSLDNKIKKIKRIDKDPIQMKRRNVIIIISIIFLDYEQLVKRSNHHGYRLSDTGSSNDANK